MTNGKIGQHVIMNKKVYKITSAEELEDYNFVTCKMMGSRRVYFSIEDLRGNPCYSQGVGCLWPCTFFEPATEDDIKTAELELSWINLCKQ
jgi:hypothetical protein